MKDTYYETLRVPETASPKEIREAFLRLSKLCHPDKNPDNKTLHEKFVKINEAYNVLSKPETKMQYDSKLKFYRGMTDFGPQKVEFRDPSIWTMRDRSQDYKYDKSKPIYGIKGLNKVSNGWIAAGALLVMCIGTVIQLTAIKYSAEFNASALDAASRKANSNLRRAREEAAQNGDLDTQFQRFQERYENSRKWN
jgi:curved DNA-binding protein CbpA